MSLMSSSCPTLIFSQSALFHSYNLVSVSSKAQIPLSSDPMQSAENCSDSSAPFIILYYSLKCGHALFLNIFAHFEHSHLTIEIDLLETCHLVLLSSRSAGLLERLHEWLEERLGMGGVGPSPELCTASYRLSMDPSCCHGKRQTYRQNINLKADTVYKWNSPILSHKPCES